jgi:hypothetical protein
MPEPQSFVKRSQSFVDRGARACSPMPPAPANTSPPSVLSDWGSPNDRLDWGIQGEEVNKFRLCGSMKGGGNGNGSRPPIKIDGMDATVFRNLLHFIYTDTLPETAQEDLAMARRIAMTSKG